MDCIFCFDSLNKKKCKTLPCEHKYHKKCLKKWENMGKKKQCIQCFKWYGKQEYFRIYHGVPDIPHDFWAPPIQRQPVIPDGVVDVSNFFIVLFLVTAYAFIVLLLITDFTCDPRYINYWIDLLSVIVNICWGILPMPKLQYIKEIKCPKGPRVCDYYSGYPTCFQYTQLDT